MLNKETLQIGGRYNWKNQPERLIYLGTNRYRGDMRTWHQFALVDKPDEVWCEVLTSDLEYFEESDTVSLGGLPTMRLNVVKREEVVDYCYDYDPWKQTGKKKAQWKSEVYGRR